MDGISIILKEGFLMKKLTALLLALIMLMSVSTVFADDERVLNICTPNSDGLRSIYPLFE